MNDALHALIRHAAEKHYPGDDPSHDFNHILRVLHNALIIQRAEGGDLDVIIPAVYFHDSVNYPKNHPRADQAATESAETVRIELLAIPGYPHEKIPDVMTAITEHSFNAGITPATLESQIVQDADRLEATGAIAIMRTYASTGQMKRPFYDAADPFCASREPNAKENALDLFFVRLLKVRDMMNTKTAKDMAAKRTQFLYAFLDELGEEIGHPVR